MKLKINRKNHTVKSREVTGQTVTYTGVTPEPETIGGIVLLLRDDGFVLAQDNADKYERRVYADEVLTLSNDPEPLPEVVVPTLDERVTALENAIKEGLAL